MMSKGDDSVNKLESKTATGAKEWVSGRNTAPQLYYTEVGVFVLQMF